MIVVSQYMCKNYRVFNSHPAHLSYTDFEGVEAAIKHYEDGIKRGMSYVFIVTNIQALKELRGNEQNSKPQTEKI